MAKRMKLGDQIRRAVKASGISGYQISRETGINESQLSRFVRGHAGLSLANLDLLADLLDLNIATPKQKGR